MTRSIVIIGASKGIGRARPEALAAASWEIIGVARSHRRMAHFPGQFVITDLSDPEGTVKLASRLAIQWQYSDRPAASAVTLSLRHATSWRDNGVRCKQ